MDAPTDRQFRVTVIQISSLLLSIAILVLGNGLQGTLLGIRAGLEGMSKESVGLMMSAYFAGYVGGSEFVPRLVVKVGYVRSFAALTSLVSAIALSHALCISEISWAILRTLHGGCFAGLILIVESWLNSCTSKEYRGRVLSIYSIVFMGAWSASHLLLNIAPPSGFTLFCIVSMLLSVALVPVTLSGATIPSSVSSTRLSLKYLYIVSPIGFLGIFVTGLAMSALIGMGPIFAQTIGLNNTDISLFMAIPMFGALTFQWPVGWISDKIDRRWVILWACLMTGIAGLAMAWSVGKSPMILMFWAYLFGGFGMPVYSVCVAHTNDHIKEEELVTVAGGLILLYGLGAALGPYIAGVAMERLGPPGLFIYAGLIEIIFVAFSIYRIPQRPAISKAVKEAFIHIPKTTHVVLQLSKLRKDSRRNQNHEAVRK